MIAPGAEIERAPDLFYKHHFFFLYRIGIFLPMKVHSFFRFKVIALSLYANTNLIPVLGKSLFYCVRINKDLVR